MSETQPQQPDGRPLLLGSKLKELRLAVPLTQAQLAAKAGISRERLSAHERSPRGACRITQIQRYAKALKCHPHDLMRIETPADAGQEQPAAA